MCDTSDNVIMVRTILASSI